jgi:hypothetical protein
VAVDRIIPSGDASIMWLVPNVSPAQAGLLATDWNATSSSGTITIKLRDGTAGSRYQVKATVNAQQVAEFSQMIISN